MIILFIEALSLKELKPRTSHYKKKMVTDAVRLEFTIGTH